MAGGRARGLAAGRRHVVNDHASQAVFVVVDVLKRHLRGGPDSTPDGIPGGTPAKPGGTPAGPRGGPRGDPGGPQRTPEAVSGAASAAAQQTPAIAVSLS